MKKLIVFSLIFALVAGVVFAADVAAGVETRLTLIAGSDAEDSDPTTGGSIAGAWLRFSGQTEDGKIGGLLSIRQTDIYTGSGGQAWHRAFVWWRPVSGLEIFLGKDSDGKFGTDAMEGWSYHQGADDYISFQHWDYWRGIYPGNWDGFGASLSYFGIDNLSLNLAIPTGTSKGWPRHRDSGQFATTILEQIYPSALRFQGGYNLPDIGRIMFAYNGPSQGVGLDNGGRTTFEDANNSGELGLSFLLTAVDGIQAHAGFSTILYKGEEDGGVEQAPIKLGASVFYTGDGFGVKFRAGVTIGAVGFDWNEAINKDAMEMRFTLMPYFNIGSMGFNVDLGLVMAQPDADSDMAMGFWLNPYLKVPMGAGSLRIGASIYSNVRGHGDQGLGSYDKDADAYKQVNFDVPMLLSFNF